MCTAPFLVDCIVVVSYQPTIPLCCTCDLRVGAKSATASVDLSVMQIYAKTLTGQAITLTVDLS